ncbi:MAG TPA: MarR family transcriptional regulator [Steroidobacteraceae bacterium]
MNKKARRSAARPSVTDHTKVDQSIGYLVRRTFRSFTSSLELRLKQHDITLSSWYFLRLLWERDGLSQKELSDELGLTQPTTVTAMDNLEALGLIERRRNAEDRRKVNIFLTKKGRQLEEKLVKYAAEVNKAALRDISAEEFRQLWDMLERINASLAKDREEYVSSAS